MYITTLAEPASEPVSVQAGKAFLRIDFEGEDMAVASLIAAARARVEAETGVCLVERTVKLSLPCWPPSRRYAHKIDLPIGPVSSLVSVHVGEEDLTHRFTLQKGRPDVLRFRGAILPYQDRQIEIVVRAGFGADESYVPADLKLAVKMLAAQAYQRGEGSVDLSMDVAVLLAPWRRVSL